MMRQQGNILQDIVSSYVGALIQREHIKNKRLDDIMTTAGNAQQAQIQRLNDRLGENLHKVLDDAPTSNYGPAPRQLGVTPYPSPPNTTEVSVPVGEDEDDDEPEQKPSKPAEDKPQTRPQESGDDKQSMSPLTAGLLGAALTMAGAGGGMAMSSYFNSDTESTPITIEQPPASDAAGGGAVDILVR